MAFEYLLLQTKRAVDANPPQVLRSQILDAVNEVDGAKSQINLLKSNAGILGKDISAAKDLTEEKFAEATNRTTQVANQLTATASMLNGSIAEVSQKATTVDSKAGQLASQLSSATGALNAGLEEVSKKATLADTKIGQVNSRVAQVSGQLTSDLEDKALKLDSKIEEKGRLHNQLRSRLSSLESDLDTAQSQGNRSWQLLDQVSKCLSGNMYLYLDTLAETVSAALLNAAAAEVFTKEFTVAFAYKYLVGEEDAYRTYSFFSGVEPVITAGEVVVDVDVATPEVLWVDDVESDPEFVYGLVNLRVVFDTDAGATKTYAPDDVVTVKVQISATDTWLSVPVAFVTKTYTVVA